MSAPVCPLCLDVEHSPHGTVNPDHADIHYVYVSIVSRFVSAPEKGKQRKNGTAITFAGHTVVVRSI